MAVSEQELERRRRSNEAHRGGEMSRKLCLRYVVTHPIAFREFFVPKVTRRRYWHRYAFTHVTLAQDLGDTLLAAGRGGGKSYALLEPEIVRHMITHPGEETVLTSLRRVHIVDRMERVIEYFEDVPFLRLFLGNSSSKKAINRSPIYIVQLRNGHVGYGISVGDDPEAKMAQGKHASLLTVEEAHQYPLRAWLKLQGAKDPRGCRVLMIGVPDGRMDTPFRNADSKYEAFKGRRVHLSRRADPYFDQKTKRELADIHGGEDSEVFRQEVDAEWGNPTWSAWDMDGIVRCFDPGLDCPVLVVSGKDYKALGITARAACADLLGSDVDAPVKLAMDVGYSQPSEIGVFQLRRNRWTLIARVKIINRMEHDDQADILHEVGLRFRAEEIGIDATEGEGRAIAATLEQRPEWQTPSTAEAPQGGTRIRRYSSNETDVAQYTPEGEEVHDTMRNIGTHILRGLFARRTFHLPVSEDIYSDFNQEMEYRSGDGVLRVKTPATVHLPDMFRVFAYLMFLNEPPVPPSDSVAPFAFPVFGASPWSEAAAW